MSNRAIFRGPFRPANLLRSRYLRKEWAVWDANLHHGDIRPFACPEFMCETDIEGGQIFPMSKCCCLVLPDCTEPVKGFCKDQWFWVDPVSCTLRQSTEEQLCVLESCRAGSPVPDRPIVDGVCTGNDFEKDYLQCLEDTRAQCDSLKQAVEDAYKAFTDCSDQCQIVGEETPECTAQRKAWQAALEAYEKCVCYLEYDCEQQSAPCDAVTMHYVVTWVTEHSGICVESAPSLPDYAVTNGNTPSNLITQPPIPADFCITRWKIYRVESDFQDATNSMPIDGSEFVLVADLPVGTTTFNDTLTTSETGYPLTTSHPMNNPAPTGVKYLDRTEDGIVVATDCQVFISVSGEPQFGLGGVVSIEDNIRAIRADGNTIFVLTDRYPVVIKYQLGDGVLNISRKTVKRELPLRSKQSVSLYGSKLFFASEFSLYAWDTSGYGENIRNQIHQLMTPDQWKMVDAGSVVGTAYEYGYLLHSKRLEYSLMFEFSGDGSDTLNQDSVMPISYVCMDSVHRDKAGHIWYKKDGKIYKWDWRRDVCDTDIHEPGRTSQCEACCPFTLRLHYDSEGKNSFHTARLEWDNRTADSMTIKIFEGYFGSHSQLGEYEVINSRAFGICGYTSAQTHWVEIKGCGVVHEFRMATSFSDLVSRNNQDLVSDDG